MMRKLAISIVVFAVIAIGVLAALRYQAPVKDNRSTVNLPRHHSPNGGFRNLPGSLRQASTRWDMARFLFQQFTGVGVPDVPEGHLLDVGIAQQQMRKAQNPSVTWLGHASFIIRLGGKSVLTDPFLSEVAGPLGFGPKRYVPSPLAGKDMPQVDVIIVSHNHYDHLDAPAIESYRFKAATQVIVPLGMGPFFTERGYARVSEADWWQSWNQDDLTITTLPAVHFSGRGLFDRNETLWASFAIVSDEQRVWFSGDTANGPVFTEIGKRSGPFDLALIAIGAYEPRNIMQAAHATPEEAVEIARSVGAAKAIGMHWGTIRLTPEDPFEAPVRFRQAAIDQGFGEANAWILKIGETRSLESTAKVSSNR